MKFRVRDDEKKGEFEVYEVRIEATTRSFIAKAVTLIVLGLLVFVAVYAAITNKSDVLNSTTSHMTLIMGFVLGHYFKRDG